MSGNTRWAGKPAHLAARPVGNRNLTRLADLPDRCRVDRPGVHSGGCASYANVRRILLWRARIVRPDTLIHLYVSGIEAVSEEFGIPADVDALAGRDWNLVNPDGNRLRVATRRS